MQAKFWRIVRMEKMKNAGNLAFVSEAFGKCAVLGLDFYTIVEWLEVATIPSPTVSWSSLCS